MSVTELRIAIRRALEASSGGDESAEARAAALFRPLETVWPVLEDLADNLSALAQLPLSIFLGGHQVYASSVKLLPPWCAFLIQHSRLRQLCVDDEKQRAAEHCESSLCHSGM